MPGNEVVLLYSGGTDSTLAACLLAEKYDKVRLITFKRFGLFSVTNPMTNVAKLKARYGQDRFSHEIISVDGIFRKVSYDRFFTNLSRHGFFLLSTCGLCKLAMHVRALIYCLEQGIRHVSDGANKGMNLFPDQQPGVIGMIRAMYAKFGIDYSNPVFEFEGPQDIEFADLFHLERIPGLAAERNPAFMENKKQTAGYKLYEMGMMPSDNVKGTALDRGMQLRCFQLILFKTWLHWYYLPFAGMDRYVREGDNFFREKINRFTALLEEYREKGHLSKLAKYVEI
ncbi:MAG: hypothetical protein ABIG11_08625 [bacterium]